MRANFNYNQICNKLFQNLPQRTKEVLSRRFGLETGTRETLEAIGKSQGVTRERIRQLEEDGFLKIKPQVTRFQKIVNYFTDQLKVAGGLRKEDILLNILGGEKFKNHVFFLLTLIRPFKRFPENEEFYSFWSLDPQYFHLAQKIIDSFREELNKTKRPLGIADFKAPVNNLNPQILSSYLEISKIVQKGPDGLFGLRDWPEINPRGIKDKAYLVLKKGGKPLHFSEVSERIGENALVQTVHNELIKDPRFVLVGRGLYALREWGYEPGVVKDIILKTLKNAKAPLSKEEVIAAVLKQRFVKENTVSLNLSDKRFFLRNPDGRYIIRQA